MFGPKPRLIKRDQIEGLITEYIESSIQMPDEQIQEMLQTMPITNETIDVIFQEYIKAGHFFWYNFDITLNIDATIKNCLFSEDFVFENDIDDLVQNVTNELRTIIMSTTGKEIVDAKTLLIFPIISEEEPETEDEEP